MDGAAQFNGAFFYYDYKDMQQSKIVSVTSLNQNTDAEITGIEGEFRWAATENLEVTANFGWVNAEIGTTIQLTPLTRTLAVRLRVLPASTV